MKKTNRTYFVRKVVVALKLSDASWRDFLTGFFDYAKRKTHWDIRITQSIEELERALPDCHGVVSGIKPSKKVQFMLARNNLPLVAVGAEWKLDQRMNVVTYIRNDNEDIGRYCARHFQSLGKFASAGFVPSNTCDDWSAARECGFFEAFSEIEKSTYKQIAEPGSDKDIEALSQWLKGLPKPVSVIGVDNDPLLCDFTTPTLTSISPDHVLEGQMAAETIDRMIRKHCGPNGRLILNTAKKMIERESARPVSPVAALLARAIAFIDAHAAENIKAIDVVEALGVSRSLLDQRFREFRNETIADAITARRLKEVARRLRQTNLSIRAISASCGFQNPNHLKNLFKREYGVSMREWRAKEESSDGRQ